MACDSAQASLTTTAAKITDAHGADRVAGAHVLLINQHATVSAFLSGSSAGATTTAGLELKAGAAIALDLQVGEEVHGRSASGTVRVDVFRSGV